MTYRALITDLDGTAVGLASKGDDITEATKQAVKTALAEGKIIACATGRGWMYAKSVVRELGIVNPCVIEGGTRIIDPLSEKTLWQKGMSVEAANDSLAAFKSFAPDGLLVSSVRDDVDDSSVEDLGNAQKNIFPAAASIDEITEEVRYVYLLGVAKSAGVAIVIS